MRGSRGLWLTFAIAIGVAVAALPFGIRAARTRATGSPAPQPAVHEGWTTYSPPDGAFDVVGPAAVHVSPIQTGIGPAHSAEFGDGTMSVTWTDTAFAGTDQEALQAGKIGLLRPLVGRLADEEVDLEDAGHPGFGLVITANGTTYTVRLFAADGRLFQVVGQGPADSEAAATAADFVASFQLG